MVKKEAQDISSTMNDSRTASDTETSVSYDNPSSDIEKTPHKSPRGTYPSPLDVEVTYPEGGRDAWLVVLGAWCGLTSSLGIYNTTGAFEVVMSKVILPETSSATIGWIFSVYAFVNWVCGVQIGPTFDAMGPRILMTAGTICTLIGMFALSVCTGESFSLPSRYHTEFILLTDGQNIIRSSCHSPYSPVSAPLFS